MRFTKLSYAFAFASVLVASAAMASERGTPNEAKVLVEKAAEHFRSVGPEKAIADFNDPKAGFADRDLFVFVYSPEGKILSSPGISAIVGRDATKMKDVDGKEFGNMIIAAAKSSKSGGWTEYRMTNPATKKVEPKKTYAIEANGYVLGSGAYNP